MPTPMRREHSGLKALNRNISTLTDGRVSPIRFQLTQPLAECAKSMQYYIKRKAAEVITASFNCFAPGQSKELFDLVTVQAAGPQDESPGDKVIKELISRFCKALHEIAATTDDTRLNHMADRPGKEECGSGWSRC